MKRNLAVVFAGLIGISRVASADPVDPYTGDPAIQLSISGAVDAKDVGNALAKELRREIRDSGEVCAAPCLTIMVADNTNDAKATIVFAATSGSIRQRTVALGSDRSQWPTVITLLAGNLVRDEAADVIGLVPARAKAPTLDMPEPVDAPEPPAAPIEIAEAPPVEDVPPVAEHPEPVKPVESRTFAIGLVPVIGTDLTNTGRSHFLSLNIIAGVNAGSTGLALAGVTDIEDQVSGVQISGVASLSDHVSGLQIGGVASIGEHVSGFQIGGAAAVADDLSGVQIGGAAAVADHVTGAQFAGAVVIAGDVDTQIGGAVAVAFGNTNLQIGGAAATAGGDADLQIAGAVAIAGGNTGVQIGGAVSVSESADVQIAGAVNVTGHLKGIQVAPINVASCVDGLQVGVVNVGGCADGDSIGLINIVRGGRYDVEASVDSNEVGTLLLRHGSRHFHNVYGLGGHPVKRDDGMPNNDVWMYGAGLGPTIRIGSTVLDLEAILWQVNHGAHHEDELSILAQGRATLGIPLGFVTLVAGGAINTYVSTDAQSPFILERSSTSDAMDHSNKVRTTVWPSAFVGVRL